MNDTLINEHTDVPGMQYEEHRLSTFSTWPSDAAVDSRRIAKAGFFFTGSQLEVECFCCGGKIKEWNYGDQVMTKHRKLNPQCPFVKNPNGSGNVPFTNVTHMGSFLSSPSQREGRETLDSTNSNEQSSLPSQSDNIVLTPSVGAILESNTQNNIDNLNSQQESPSQSNESSEAHMLAANNDQLSMHRERDRLRTFDGWPVSFLRPEDLARNGFFYTHERDNVRCVFCCGSIGQWEEGDDPASDHRKHFPNCPFVCGLDVGNVTADQEDAAEPTPHRNSSDNINRTTSVDVRPFSAPERSHFNNLSLDPALGNANHLEELGITRHHGPKNPSYSTVEARLRTFKDWPFGGVRQPAEDMAAAGFYYTGQHDYVRCFHCDGGLRHWEPTDDPWREHARWFSHCAFVLLVKGEDFVRECVEQAPPVLPPVNERSPEPTRQERPRPTAHVRQVTEEELVGLMGTPHAVAALQIGIDPSRIKMALRQKMEQTGLPFTTVDSLIETCLDLQMGEARINETDELSVDYQDEEIFHVPPVRRGVRGPPPSLQDQASQQLQIPQHTSLTDIKNVTPAQSETFNVSSASALSGSLRSLPGSMVNHRSSADNLSRPSPHTLGLTTSQSMPQMLQCRNAKGECTQDSMALEEENRRLKEARLCKVCMDEEVGVVFLPCGHLITCVQCAPALGDCPMCRQPIKGSVRTFLS